jgi:hypothetical protein
METSAGAAAQSQGAQPAVSSGWQQQSAWAGQQVAFGQVPSEILCLMPARWPCLPAAQPALHPVSLWQHVG